MAGWVAGWNLTCYMPDPDNVWVTEDYESALSYIDDAIERHGDHAFDCLDMGDLDSSEEVEEAQYARERISEIREKRNEENFYERVGYQSYWIEWSDEATPENDE